MTEAATRESIQALARALQARHGYAPLSQALGLASEGLFDACLACPVGEDLHVLAFLAGPGGLEDLAQRAESLRRALEAGTGGHGRVHARVWRLAPEAEAQTLADALEPFEDGHFLARVLVGRGVLGAGESALRVQGRAQTLPDGAELGRLLADPGADPGPAAVDELLRRRQVDERQSQRLLQPGPSPATWVLLGLNVAAYGVQFTATQEGLSRGLDLAQAHWQSILALGANLKDLTLHGQPWRVLSSAFLHDNLLHLGFNLAALYSLGTVVERMAGPWRTLGLYLISAVLAGFLSALALPPGVPSLGASGAILGLAGVLLAARWRRHPAIPAALAQRLQDWLARPLLWIFVVGLGLRALGLPLQFDNAAHLGGLCTGFSLGYLYPSFLVRSRRTQA